LLVSGDNKAESKIMKPIDISKVVGRVIYKY